MSLWIHCKRFDYHSSLFHPPAHLLVLEILSFIRLFTFVYFSELPSFSSAFAPAQRIIGSADHRISGSADQRISGSVDQWIRGSSDQWISGSSDQRISGSADQRISGSADQRIGGSADRRISGSADHRIGGSADQRIKRISGSSDQRIRQPHDHKSNSGHCCCTTVKLHELCYPVWQVSNIEKVLIPLIDAQVSQLTSDQ